MSDKKLDEVEILKEKILQETKILKNALEKLMKDKRKELKKGLFRELF